MKRATAVVLAVVLLFASLITTNAAVINNYSDVDLSQYGDVISNDELGEIYSYGGYVSKEDYLCSGLVYCQCGAKMHAMKSSRKGHTYHYFYCSKRCGAPVVRMETVDKAAKEYLVTLLSEDNQTRISKALRSYKGAEKERIEDFNTILKSRIDDKQERYNTLLDNLSSGVLPPEVVSDTPCITYCLLSAKSKKTINFQTKKSALQMKCGQIILAYTALK